MLLLVDQHATGMGELQDGDVLVVANYVLDLWFVSHHNPNWMHPGIRWVLFVLLSERHDGGIWRKACG